MQNRRPPLGPNPYSVIASSNVISSVMLIAQSYLHSILSTFLRYIVICRIQIHDDTLAIGSCVVLLQYRAVRGLSRPGRSQNDLSVTHSDESGIGAFSGAKSDFVHFQPICAFSQYAGYQILLIPSRSF